MKTPENRSTLSDTEIQEKLRSLLHKEGCWVDWGMKCQELQKAGCSPQKIFENAGFQASQQNLIIVASQVYNSIVKEGASQEILNYYQGPKTDVLYELRILNQQQRAKAAELAYDKKLDIDGAREIAKAIRDVSLLSQLPSGFTDSPGDMVAYISWKRARRKKDLSERSRLIAQGLKFAHSQSARENLEKLLSDFTVVKSKTEPLLPIYRLELEEELPRIIPLAGTYPLTAEEILLVNSVTTIQPFGTIEVDRSGSFVPVPGWQSVLKAQDPIGYFCNSEHLPQSISGKAERVLIIIDRSCVDWNVHSYFLIETEGKLELRWFEESPNIKIIGQLIVVMRAKKILDEGNITQPWQMDD